jgi:GalNAc-alpha-(1->4)-GalNAc-alpha-(1->3)-diNAcBac-PP-undecaprenol alpha-1,4-N-acetyl-D-galactosaminyltransferase
MVAVLSSQLLDTLVPMKDLSGGTIVQLGRPQRITLVISSLGRGGAERVAVDLCSFLAESGRDVSVLTLSGDDPDAYDLPASIHRRRIEIRREARSRFQSIKFTLNHLMEMRRSILALEPDIVLSFIEQTNIRIIGCLAGTGIPVLVSERIHPGHHPVPRSWAFLRRVVYRFASAVIVQNDNIADWFRKFVPTRRLLTIPNAVRGSTFLGDHRGRLNEPIILGIGRLAQQKGFDLLLRAFSNSGLADDGWRLVVLGEGDERKALSKLSDDLGVSESIEMPGHVTNVSDWISRSSIFALPSRYEGFPNALLEAMQLGTACVSFDCPSGPGDLIEDGSNGLLVAPNDVDALSQALRKLALDEPLRERLAREAAKVSATFSMDRVYGLWMETLDSI